MFERVDVSRMDAAAALDLVEAAERVRLLADVQRATAMLRVVRSYRHEVPADKVRLGADGTPLVDDFACLELAAALRREPVGVTAEVAELLTLQARHPQLWAQVCRAAFPLWRARRIARMAWELPLELALWLDASLAPFLTRLAPSRLFSFVEALVVQADPQAANERFVAAQRARRVNVHPSQDGVCVLTGLLDAADAIYLDAALSQLSDILAVTGSTEGSDVRRAMALGILATPARALAMIQGSLQPTLDTETVTSTRELPPATSDRKGEVARQQPARSPLHCAGHSCGTITVDPERLLPRATLVVHLSERTLDLGHGLARAEGVGAVTLEQLQVLLHNRRIVIQPVFDPDGVVPVDCYEIPARVRRAVLLRHPREVWPYGGRSSAGLDLDHTRPYQWDGTPAQTAVDNLGPLARKAHRAKTHAGWQVTRAGAGGFDWMSPLGRRYLVTAAGLTYAADGVGGTVRDAQLLPDPPRRGGRSGRGVSPRRRKARPAG
ncbi:MAG: DUF222 domain-containing protein, partial [Propionicimonas sp.]|nr:DUF222 domain-containing protein [Propionicimonas sp.]